MTTNCVCGCVGVCVRHKVDKISKFSCTVIFLHLDYYSTVEEKRGCARRKSFFLQRTTLCFILQLSLLSMQPRSLLVLLTCQQACLVGKIKKKPDYVPKKARQQIKQAKCWLFSPSVL